MIHLFKCYAAIEIETFLKILRCKEMISKKKKKSQLVQLYNQAMYV